jgi:hypothetical protein
MLDINIEPDGNGVSKIKAESFRLAKFNNDTAVRSFYNLLQNSILNLFLCSFPFSTFTKSSMVSLTCAIDTFVLARKGYNYKKYKQDMVPCQEFYIRTLIRKKHKG